MSVVTGYPNCRRSLHRRDDSDELDVFEAAQYYTDTDNAPNNNTLRDTQERHSNNTGSCLSTNNNFYVTPKSSHGLEKHQQMKEILKNSRSDPSSPGGRIASFLNSLFSQSDSKKKKKSSSTKSSFSSSSSTTAKSSSVKEEYDVDSWKRRRRSSISHFPSSSTRAVVDSSSRSLYSSSSSGFRTPPPYVTTPSSKSYKEASSAHKKRSMDKKYIINRGLSNKYGGTMTTVETEFRKFGDEDIGAESDSSSDLFELPNYNLGFELPVYETTHINNIKRGTSISNAIAAA